MLSTCECNVLKVDLLKRPKAYMGETTEGKRQIQSIKGEMKPRTAKKVKTNTWTNVEKGLKIDDKLETPNSDKNGDESETTNSVQIFNLEMLNQLKAKRKEGHEKRRQHHEIKGVGKGLPKELRRAESNGSRSAS